MADSAVAINGLKALKIALHLTAKVAFYEHLLRIDRMNNGVQLLRRQIFRADIGVDIGDLKDPLGIAQRQFRRYREAKLRCACRREFLLQGVWA